MATPVKPKAPGNWTYDGAANRWINAAGKADLGAVRNTTPAKTNDKGFIVSPVLPSKISKAIVATGPKKPTFDTMSVAAQQKLLNQHGFNVTVDGLAGPQTAMARKAMLNGVSANYWNKVWAKNHPKTSPSAGAEKPSGGTPVSSSNDTPPAQVTKPPAGAAGLGGVPDLPAAGIDPAKYAQQSVNAEYGPQINDATANLNYAKKAGPEALLDLLGWNKQVTNTFNNYDAAGNFDPSIEAQKKSAGNISNLFGGATAAEAQRANAPSANLLGDLQQSQTGFQNIMQSVLAAQGRDYARRATRENKNDVTKAQDSLTALRTAKGQAQSKALYDAQNLQINQDTARQALEQAKALQGPTIDAANANARVAQTEANNAPTMARLKLKEAQANAKATIAAAQQAADKTSGKVNWNDPALIQSVANDTISGAIGAKGGLVLRPDLALQNILVAAQGAGAPASVVQAAISKLVRSLNISHGKKQWSRWAWNGKNFVLKPAPKK